MSARHPHHATPLATEPRLVTFHGSPEGVLSVILERGYPVAIHKPELNSRTITLQITATRQQIKDARKEEAVRFEATNRLRSLEWWRAWHLAQMSDPPRGGWDVILRRSRIYTGESIVVECAVAHGLRVSIVRPIPEGTYSVANITAKLPEYRAAQFEWLQRMIQMKPSIDLFA